MPIILHLVTRMLLKKENNLIQDNELLAVVREPSSVSR